MQMYFTNYPPDISPRALESDPNPFEYCQSLHESLGVGNHSDSISLKPLFHSFFDFFCLYLLAFLATAANQIIR